MTALTYNTYNKNSIRFNKLSTFNLWECEISGQLSDGKWENYSGAQPWWPLKAEFVPELADNETLVHNCHFKYERAVNVVSKDLVDLLWERMTGYITLGNLGYNIKRFDSIVDDITTHAHKNTPFATMVEELHERDAKWTWYKLGEFMDAVGLNEEKLQSVYNELLATFIKGENACKKLVRNELRAIHAAMKNVKRA